jgi:hypothetical protein
LQESSECDRGWASTLRCCRTRSANTEHRRLHPTQPSFRCYNWSPPLSPAFVCTPIHSLILTHKPQRLSSLLDGHQPILLERRLLVSAKRICIPARRDTCCIPICQPHLIPYAHTPLHDVYSLPCLIGSHRAPSVIIAAYSSPLSLPNDPYSLLRPHLIPLVAITPNPPATSYFRHSLPTTRHLHPTAPFPDHISSLSLGYAPLATTRCSVLHSSPPRCHYALIR